MSITARDDAPADTGTPSGPDAATRPPKKRTGAGSTQIARIEEQLGELFGTIVVAQSGLAIMTGDARHMAGAQVTSEMAPLLVESWCDLAEKNPAVRAVLVKMSEGTAWGGVIAINLGFIYSKAQAYNAVPRDLPNPWIQLVPEA